jgi:parvulin-like peptidyl-prolyl isomerase
MRFSRVPLLATVVVAVACGASSNPEVAATAGSQQLATTRLAEILGKSQAPLEKDAARAIAELWVNYHLAGTAAAKGDSLSDQAEMQSAMQSTIDNLRVRRFYEKVSAGWDTLAPAPDSVRYNQGELLAASHILVKSDSTASPEQRAAARAKAEGIRKEATPANFAALAAKSDEPGAKERGGSLGVFVRDQMVPEFSKGVLAIKPGEISPIVETAYGYHVIYRPRFDEVKEQFAPAIKQRNVAVAESTYLTKLEGSNEIKVETEAAVRAKAIVRNPLGFRKSSKALGRYKGGELTEGEFADWVASFPPQMQIRIQVLNAPDTLVDRFIRQGMRNELVLRQADSAKVVPDTAELNNMYLTFKTAVGQAWAGLGVEPAKVADSAKAAGGDAAKWVAGRIESYFDKLVKNEAPFVDLPYPVARALQKKFDFSVNDAALDKAVERAKGMRASADSARALQGPPAGAPAPAPAPAPRPDSAPPAKQ